MNIISLSGTNTILTEKITDSIFWVVRNTILESTLCSSVLAFAFKQAPDGLPWLSYLNGRHKARKPEEGVKMSRKECYMVADRCRKESGGTNCLFHTRLSKKSIT